MGQNLRWIYVGWFGIVTAAIILQFYLAGYGVFAFKGLKDFEAHFVVGDLIGIAILIGIGLAFAARVPRRLILMNAGLAVLMIVQFLLAHTGIQAVSALHVVNGLLIFGGTIAIVREATQFARAGGAARA